MKFLFTDPYFIPVFGNSVDNLSDKQINTIYTTLSATQWAQNPCKGESFLMSIYPGTFLARVFDPRFENSVFSKSFVDAHAKASRAQSQNKETPGKDTIKLIQKRIKQAGFNIRTADGVVGPSTINGIIEYKTARNMQPLNGELSPALLARLDAYHVPVPKITTTTRRQTPTTQRLPTTRPTIKPRREALVDKSDPDSLKRSMNALIAGNSINLNGPQRSYFAGVAGIVLKNCPSIASYSDRSRLTGLITSVMFLDPITDMYTSDNFGRTMKRGASSAGLLNAGTIAGNRLGCGTQAEEVISALVDSL